MKVLVSGTSFIPTCSTNSVSSAQTDITISILVTICQKLCKICMQYSISLRLFTRKWIEKWKKKEQNGYYSESC